MNVDECMRIKDKKINRLRNNKIKYFNHLITRVLISIILFISAGIISRINNDNTSLINKYFFTDSIKFTSINNWYHNNLGKLIPEVKTNTTMVFNNTNILNNNYEKYYDGVKIETLKGSPISSINGGIVVFIGDKENYGNTLIIQGNDGIDYWYGNITNINVNLYDYLEKDTLLGETLEDYLYIVLARDGKYLDYEEYIK